MKLILLILVGLGAPGCSSLFIRKIESPYLYKMTKGNKTVYGFGTIHSGVSFREIPRTVTDKIKISDALVTEIDYPRKGQKWEAYLDQKKVLRQSKILMQDWLDEDELKELNKVLKRWPELMNKQHCPSARKCRIDYAYRATLHYLESSEDSLEKDIKQGRVSLKAEYLNNWDTLKFQANENAHMDKRFREYAGKNGLILDFLDSSYALRKDLFIVSALVTISRNLRLGIKYRLIYSYRNYIQIANSYIEKTRRRYEAYRAKRYRDFDFEAGEINEKIRDLSNKTLLEMRNKHWAYRMDTLTEVHDTVFVVAGLAHFEVDKTFLDFMQELGWTKEKP